MDKQVCFSLLVIFYFAPVFSQEMPPVPCPKYFRYKYSPSGDVEGLITLPYDGSGSLYLQVNASMRGYFGKEHSNMKLALLTPPNNILQRQATEVDYKLTFPKQESIPQITSIVLNKKSFCTGPPLQTTNGAFTHMAARFVLMLGGVSRSSAEAVNATDTKDSD